MKKISLIVVVLILLVAVEIGMAGATDSTAAGSQENHGSGEVKGGSMVDVYAHPTQELSQDEIKGILYMREEEKLARDVYIVLYDKTGISTFNSIAKSE